MSLRRKLAQTLLLQGAGAASLLLAAIGLGHRLGPDVQGAFNRMKAELEFVAALALFGMPQALFYFSQLGRLARGRALRALVVAAAVAMLVMTLVLIYRAYPPVVTATMVTAVAAQVLHGGMRGLLLAGAGTLWFNLVTAAPQILMLCMAGVWIAFGNAPMTTMAAGFALAFGISAAAAAWRLNAMPSPARAQEPVHWREVGRYGAANGTTAVLATLAVLMMQRALEADAGLADWGRFSLGLMLAQIPLVPFLYAAPVLFRHWMARRPPDDLRPLMLAGAPVLAIAGAVAGIGLVRSDLFLGVHYTGLSGVVSLLLVGSAAEVLLRLLAVQFNAAGKPGPALRAEFVRVVVLIAAVVITGVPGALSAAAWWCLALWSAAAFLVLTCIRGQKSVGEA